MQGAFVFTSLTRGRRQFKIKYRTIRRRVCLAKGWRTRIPFWEIYVVMGTGRPLGKLALHSRIPEIAFFPVQVRVLAPSDSQMKNYLTARSIRLPFFSGGASLSAGLGEFGFSMVF
ncbi:hypothetical protein CDAR_43291 [Caerostris darwini]|uniref:Uncharacterized protein n=1 Tax=Caerostris darwini TaxID=1538125 RepID=A0AAV4WJ56_9ARAC|nr:hypothetical protein CDAR_43291 [Caerostris darwini]